MESSMTIMSSWIVPIAALFIPGNHQEDLREGQGGPVLNDRAVLFG